MKLIVTGDKHLGLVSDGMSRYDEQFEILQYIVKTVQRIKPDIYVDLGDLFHNPNPSVESYHLASMYIQGIAEYIRESKAYAFFMTGNHDKKTQSSIHALSPFSFLFRYMNKAIASDMDHLYVIDKPTYQYAKAHKVGLMFFPYVTEYEAINNHKKESARICLDDFAFDAMEYNKDYRKFFAFSHLEIPGAEMSNGETVQRCTGLDIPDFLLRQKNLVQLFAGHIHKPQKVNKATIVGSSIRVNFGEYDDEKRFIYLEY